MSQFCVKCGAPVSTGPFCVKCGADTRNLAEPFQPRSPQPVAQIPSPQAVFSPSSVSAKQGMSTLAKLGIAAIVIIFVGGAAGAVGVYYVAHKVSQKYHEVSDEILGSSPDSSSKTESGSSGADGSGSRTGSLGNVCRFLRKEDVSKAIGVPIVRTEPVDNGCSGDRRR